MKKRDKERAFAKFLAGIANRVEEDKVIGSPEVEALMRDQWNSNPSQLEKAYGKPNRFKMLASIYKRIGMLEASAHKKTRLQLIRRFSAAAAVIMVIILSGVSTLFIVPLVGSGTVSFTNPGGVNSEIFLPDGSRIWLSPNSSVRYNRSFDKNTRKVELKGEAFFNVSYNPSRPFIVKTETMDVEVKGTRFGVIASPKSRTSEVSLVKGRVSVIGRYEGASRRIDLVPGQRVIWSASTGEYKMQPISGGMAKPWGSTLLRFENETFSSIANKIHETFGIDVVIPSELGEKYRFTASFADESVFEIFNLLKITAPFDFYLQGNRVIVTEKPIKTTK